MWGLASELKQLAEFSKGGGRVAHFPPGHCASWTFPEQATAKWSMDAPPTRYHSLGFVNPTGRLVVEWFDTLPDIYEEMARRLRDAVYKRCCATERPIACLLSGGLDSSLVAALVMEFHRDRGLPPVETYSIGVAGSTDLAFAQKVALHLGTQHTEIVLTEQDFIDAVPDVIRDIESYDTTTVRASIGNWLLGKYICEHSEAKVIFNGDGSDELTGGYLYMAMAPDALEFDRECRRLLGDIYAFDVLRSDKCISSHGLEPRTPFLDRNWVAYYLSLSPSLRFQPMNMEKLLLRDAFAHQDLLPIEVLYRRKEAFSDGVTGTQRSLFQILQDHAATLTLPDVGPGGVVATTAEQRWYRSVFDSLYPDAANVVPYFWMPKYVDASDASARTWIV
jgi:asparagine synthase (glutamine-hydrolysing)